MAILQEFKKFALRGNVVDMAVAFTVGAAFSTIAKSLVDDIIMPPIGLVLGGADFTNYFWVIKAGAKVEPPYGTLDAAQKAGAVTLNYGSFINHMVAFLVVAIAMFIIIRMVNKADEALEGRFSKKPKEAGEPSDKKCPYCLSTIPYHATRCPQCTSQLEETGTEPG